MPRKIHGIVKDSSDNQDFRLHAADQEVSGTTHESGRGGVAALREMPGEDALSELGSSLPPHRAFGRGRIPDRSDDERLVALASPLPELSVRPRKDGPDVIRSGLRQPIHGHEDDVERVPSMPSRPM